MPQHVKLSASNLGTTLPNLIFAQQGQLQPEQPGELPPQLKLQHLQHQLRILSESGGAGSSKRVVIVQVGSKGGTRLSGNLLKPQQVKLTPAQSQSGQQPVTGELQPAGVKTGDPPEQAPDVPGQALTDQMTQRPVAAELVVRESKESAHQQLGVTHPPEVTTEQSYTDGDPNLGRERDQTSTTRTDPAVQQQQQSLPLATIQHADEPSLGSIIPTKAHPDPKSTLPHRQMETPVQLSASRERPTQLSFQQEHTYNATWTPSHHDVVGQQQRQVKPEQNEQLPEDPRSLLATDSFQYSDNIVKLFVERGCKQYPVSINMGKGRRSESVMTECELCKIPFRAGASMTKHMESVHSVKATFICWRCDANFCYRQELR